MIIDLKNWVHDNVAHMVWRYGDDCLLILAIIWVMIVIGH